MTTRIVKASGILRTHKRSNYIHSNRPHSVSISALYQDSPTSTRLSTLLPEAMGSSHCSVALAVVVCIFATVGAGSLSATTRTSLASLKLQGILTFDDTTACSANPDTVSAGVVYTSEHVNIVNTCNCVMLVYLFVGDLWLAY